RRFPGVWPDALARIAQGGGDLGARQARVFAAGGCPPRPSRQGKGGGTLVIGTDAPQVTRADIAAAFRLLKRHDAVIGPAADGGYWLFGLARPAPPGLFDGVRWSHAETRADLKARLHVFGLARIAHLRTLRDVDHAADLAALNRDGT
ncbi:MAG: TIGR04282 family arsenosugar biosynthesis glycosyltransferase, partial [Oceanicaulis sp.]